MHPPPHNCDDMNGSKGLGSKGLHYRVVEFDEVNESWDAETTSSWTPIVIATTTKEGNATTNEANDDQDGLVGTKEDGDDDSVGNANDGNNKKKMNNKDHYNDNDKSNHNNQRVLVEPPAQIHIPNMEQSLFSWDSDDGDDDHDNHLSLCCDYSNSDQAIAGDGDIGLSSKEQQQPSPVPVPPKKQLEEPPFLDKLDKQAPSNIVAASHRMSALHWSTPRFPVTPPPIPKVLLRLYMLLQTQVPQLPPPQQQQQQQQQPRKRKEESVNVDGPGRIMSMMMLKQHQYRRKQPSIIESKPTKCFSAALLLWVLEMILLITLKRFGVMEPEFRWNDVVSEHIFASLKNESRWWVPSMEIVQSLKLWGRNSSLFAKSLMDLTSHDEKKRPGFQLAQQGAQAQYPLVIIPGFVTSGLEVWGGKECARKYFRQRLWAAMFGARSFFADRDCWRQHMMLDPWTGGDPEGIRLRASSGFEAVDYFLANYWVFGKLIENLADVGYTPSEMSVETYDWRLAFPLMEQRDGYFTRLKYKIEALSQSTGGKKVVMTSHSMGVLVVHYFFAWVTTPKEKGGGGGGHKWVDEHIHAFVNIAGTHLGVPKAVSALLSGEMSDTVVMMNPMATAVEQFFGRKLRQELWNTWGSVWAMLPKGGNAMWGIGADMCNTTTTAETADPFCTRRTFIHNNDNGNNKDNDSDHHSKRMAPFLSITDSQEDIDAIVGPRHAAVLTWRRNNLILHHHNNNNNTKHLADHYTGASPVLRQYLAHDDFSLQTTLDYIQAYGGGFGSQLANAQMYTLQQQQQLHGSPSSSSSSSSSQQQQRPKSSEPAWHDPTQTPLPYAPNMRMYCLYGVGRPTERAYYYKMNKVEQPPLQPPQGTLVDSNNNDNPQPANDITLQQPPLILDADMSNPDDKVVHGVKYSDGDGSVPLLSLGYLCANAYQRRNSGLNPSQTRVYTREYYHRPEFTVDDPMRSGPTSGDHVDVLGNVDVTTDLLRILTDFELDQVNQNVIHSDIHEIAQEIHDQGGGLFSSSRPITMRRK